MGKKVTLAGFLITGKLSLLTTGLKVEEVLALLGPPDGYKTITGFYKHLKRLKIETAQPLNLGYGNLMVSFVEDELRYLVIYFREDDPGYLPDVLEIEWLQDVYKMDVQKFRAYVNEHNIKCQRIIYPWSSEGLELHLYIPISGVLVAFTIEDGQGQIYSISKSTLEGREFPKEDW